MCKHEGGKDNMTNIIQIPSQISTREKAIDIQN